ncbi:hypothetical protein KAU32_02845 [bacterium]|nr:hypothetical protein [bacterium]
MDYRVPENIRDFRFATTSPIMTDSGIWMYSLSGVFLISFSISLLFLVFPGPFGHIGSRYGDGGWHSWHNLPLYFPVSIVIIDRNGDSLVSKYFKKNGTSNAELAQQV